MISDEFRQINCPSALVEVQMHIHGNQSNLNAVNPYYAAAEKAPAAQRAAKVRKKLSKSASEIEGAAIPEETLMIGRWLDARPRPAQSDDCYNTSATGKVQEFG